MEQRTYKMEEQEAGRLLLGACGAAASRINNTNVVGEGEWEEKDAAEAICCGRVEESAVGKMTGGGD